MRILVTGASGVIGMRAVPELARLGHHVTAIGRSPEKRAQLQRLGASAVSVDIFDAGQVDAALRNHDVVINLATHIPPASKMLLPGAWHENDRIRSVASGILSRASLKQGVGTFIQESFAPIYADAGDRWIDENSPVKPVRYNRSVLDAEAAAHHFTEAGGTGIVLRIAGFYGPDAEQVPAMLQLLSKGWSPLPGPRDAFVSFVSHDDAAAAVVAALQAKAGVYNVVDSEPLPRAEFLNYLASLLHARAPRFFPTWTTHLFGSVGEMLARSLRMSNEKFRRETNWTPLYPSAREGWQSLLPELFKAA